MLQLVPVFEFPDKSYNAYLLDFYKHGQQEALVRYNELREDAVWDALNEFDLCLKALLAAMERRVRVSKEWVEYADVNVLDTFRIVSDKFHAQLRAIAS